MTERQERFAAAYRACGDAAEAAIRAGYSPGRARRQGLALLKLPEVAMAVAGARTPEPECVTMARIQRELARIAFDNEEVRDGDKLRALEMLTKLLPPQSDGGEDEKRCGVVILPEVMAAEETRSAALPSA